MENYAYAASYPDSGHSSPRSREIDFENTAAWDENSASANNLKVKFMCSYGGKIQPRPHDNQLSYVGGETKILVVDRSTKFAGLISKLSSLCDADVCFKYQLPGEDLDALISVTNDDDLEHMMHEYDRLWRGSKPARLRLFLFPLNAPAVTPTGSFGSSEGRSEREKLVEALNSVPAQNPPPPPPQPAAVAPSPANNFDFLFGLEKGVQQQQPLAARAHIPGIDPDMSGRIMDDPIQRHIQDLKRLQIGGGQGEPTHRRRSDENLSAGFGGEYCGQKIPEKFHPAHIQSNLQANMSGPGGVFTPTMPAPEQAVYMIPAQAGLYHAQMGRVPVTGSAGPGYYAAQAMPPEVYRDQQQAYGVVSQVGAPPVPTMAQQQAVAAFTEGFGGMGRPANTGGVKVVDAGYKQVAYDNGIGRQVFYNVPGGVIPPQYSAVDMRAAEMTSNQEGKIVKATPGSM